MVILYRFWRRDTTTLATAPDCNSKHIAGHSVVMVFGGRDSTDQARQISRAIRSRYDDDGNIRGYGSGLQGGEQILAPFG